MPNIFSFLVHLRWLDPGNGLLVLTSRRHVWREIQYLGTGHLHTCPLCTLCESASCSGAGVKESLHFQLEPLYLHLELLDQATTLQDLNPCWSLPQLVLGVIFFGSLFLNRCLSEPVVFQNIWTFQWWFLFFVVLVGFVWLFFGCCFILKVSRLFCIIVQEND